MELIPEMDEGEVSVTVSMPNGSTMEDTAAIEDRIAAIAVDTIPELEQIHYSTGSFLDHVLVLGRKRYHFAGRSRSA